MKNLLNRSNVRLFATLFIFFFNPFVIRTNAANQVITDFKKWNHPTKNIFINHGITINRVEIIDKVKPVFFVLLPITASIYDTEGMEVILNELAKANGYWSYRIIDSTKVGVDFDVEVICDPKKKSVIKIDYLKTKSGLNDFKYHKIFRTPQGNVDVYDISKDLDSNIYRIVYSGKSVIFNEEGFYLDTLKIIPFKGEVKGKRFFMVSALGGGIKCHEQFRLIEFNSTNKPIASDSFGFCEDFNDAFFLHDTLVVAMTYLYDENKKKNYKWIAGHFINK